MWERVTRIFWGTPARKVITVLTPVVLMPFWVVNFESFLVERGLNRLLVDGSPISNALTAFVGALFSLELRWAVIGALVVLVIDGWCRYRTVTASVDAAALFDKVSRAYHACQKAGTLSIMPVVLGEIRSAYHALEKAGIATPAPDESFKIHCGRASFFLGAIKPLIRDGFVDKAREEAPYIIKSMNLSPADRETALKG